MNEKFFDLQREKQDRIINAAIKIFAQNGYKHASTDVIVKEAGISKGLLFHYFSSKSGLYSFLFDYSVKYMLFEYSRAISADEKDYFNIRKAMEGAKLNVLRNYPFMSQFIDCGMTETQADVVDSIADAKNTYAKAMDKYLSQGKTEALQPAVNKTTLENLIRFTVDGLTNDQMQADSYQPEILYEQITMYLDILRDITKK